MSDYLFDRSGHDDEIADLERSLGTFAHQEPLRETSLRSRVRPRLLVGIGAVLAAAAVLLVIVLRDPSRPSPCSTASSGMPFSTSQGSSRCGGAVARTGTVPAGTWLETSRDALTHVDISTIGSLTVFGDSRLRVVESAAHTQHLELARGRIRAKVTAPPRLFVVDTPAAAAVDLGCAYELSVDDRGETHVVVTSGAVSLESPRGTVLVLAGMEAHAPHGGALGIPLAVVTSAAVREAALRFDAGDAGAVIAIVEHATAADIVTLWHLIPRVDGALREQVVRRLDALVTIPFDYAVEDMLAAKPDALAAWREDIEWEWTLR